MQGWDMLESTTVIRKLIRSHKQKKKSDSVLRCYEKMKIPAWKQILKPSLGPDVDIKFEAA